LGTLLFYPRNPKLLETTKNKKNDSLFCLQFLLLKIRAGWAGGGRGRGQVEA
jgi:hypothetical protein